MLHLSRCCKCRLRLSLSRWAVIIWETQLELAVAILKSHTGSLFCDFKTDVMLLCMVCFTKDLAVRLKPCSLRDSTSLKSTWHDLHCLPVEPSVYLIDLFYTNEWLKEHASPSIWFKRAKLSYAHGMLAVPYNKTITEYVDQQSA